MININLKPGVKRQAAKGSPFAGVGDSIKGIGSRIKEPWLAGAMAVWAAVILGFGVLFFTTSSKISRLEPELQKSLSDYRRVQGVLVQKRHEELSRDSLLAQMGTISAVDADRYTWSHILDEISAALPDFTWLTSITPVVAAADAVVDSTGAPPVVLKIVGRTSDLPNYTAFLRRLEDSPWLSNVTPLEAKSVADKNRLVNEFTVQVMFSRADSSHIRTVPILESVVR